LNSLDDLITFEMMITSRQQHLIKEITAKYNPFLVLIDFDH